MPNVLSDAQVRHFREQGYVAPIRAVGEDEATDCRRRLEAFENETGQPGDLPIKGHLYLDWAWRLTRHPRVIGAVVDLIGPDVFVMASRFWIKNPQDRKFVSWHQDLAYFGLDPQEMVTFWMALTPVTRDNGCMRFIPGSHTGPSRKHVETYDKDNLLARGQVVPDVDDSAAVDVVLRPGEFSIHHGHLLHSSEANTTDDRRIGFGMMLFPAHARSTIGRRSVTLVHGTDRYGHWDHDPMPTCDRDPVIWELMQQGFERYRDRRVRQEAEGSGLVEPAQEVR
jgi:hypothetical protein